VKTRGLPESMMWSRGEEYLYFDHWWGRASLPIAESNSLFHPWIHIIFKLFIDYQIL
jgi:hypothetical protein